MRAAESRWNSARHSVLYMTWLALISVIWLLGSASSAYGAPNTGGEWAGGKAKVTSWYPVPDGGGWTNSLNALPQRDRIFRYEIACMDDGRNNIDVACLARLPQCDDAEDGRVVVWESASTEVQPLQWRRLDGYSCLYAEEPVDVMDQIARDIHAAFADLPIDAGGISGQPAPHTLRGAETNFYADASDQSANFELHGQEIHLDARPVQYEWDYGDGARGGPFLFPGGPLQEGEWGTKTATSHIFEETGDVAVRLSVTYRATYRVNGGVVVDVPGDATFTASPLTVSVWRSVVNNFADNCIENPNGAGC